MHRYLLSLLLLIPLCASAGSAGYSCSISQILELRENGEFVKHEGVFRTLIGQSFTINRNTGEMEGPPFSTETYKSVTIFDRGSEENSYKALAVSHGPNLWVVYIYVAEHQSGKMKPFWGTDDGNKIFSGLCR